MAAAHLFARRFDEASAWAEKAYRELPTFLMAIAVVAASHMQAGRIDEGRRAMDRLRALDPALRISGLKDWLSIRRAEDLADVARRAGVRMRSALLCVALLIAVPAFADGAKTAAAEGGSPAIQLGGAVNAPGEIWIKTLQALPAVTVTISQATDKSPVNATFKGALLWSVIDAAGWKNTPEKNSYLRHTILVSGADGYAVFLYGQELKNVTTGESIFRPGFAFKFPADGGPPQLVKITDQELANILKSFNTESGFAGKFPDQDIALLEDNPDLIRDLRKQIEEQSPANNPALESLRQFMATKATVAIPDIVDPYSS